MSAPAANPEQRMAADPALSVWVSANAGSGKTKVLVDRVMRLMLAGTPPDRILALTYTRSAAAEMANRLSEVLGTWATADAPALENALSDLLDRAPSGTERKLARQLFTRALDTPGGLSIRTIHGFCQSLLARFPVEAGIAPHFRLIEGSEQKDLLAEAKDEVLAGLAEHDDEAVRAVLDIIMAEVEQTGFDPLIAGLMHGRARGRLGEAMAEMLSRIRSRLALSGADTRESILAEACADGACDQPALQRAIAALARGGTSDSKRGAAIEAWWKNTAARGAQFESVYQLIFLTKDGEVRKQLTTKAVDKIDPQAADTLNAEAQRLLAVKARLAAVDLARLSGLIIGLSRNLLAAYDTRKRQHAVLDYDDLIDRTVALLQKPGIAPWVLWKLDGGIDHILVDEAQDTAPDQWRIVSALAEEFFTPGTARTETRTIFAVGDEKQSIYGFQGAAPAEFGRFKGLFAAAATAAGKAFQPVDLGLSFRSAPAILKAVDTVFATPQMQAAVTAGGHWVDHRANRSAAHGLVEIWPTVKPEAGDEEPEAWDAPLDRLGADDPQSKLAQQITTQVKAWLAAGTGPEDILILVRRRNAFVDELVRRFKAAQVPVAGADRMQLLEQIAVRDLLAAIGTAILPEDDLTLACVLRSPLIGLSEDDLFILARDRPGRLWNRLIERRGDPRFTAAHARVAGWLAAADRLPPFEFLSRILEQEGGRKALAGRLGPESGDPIDELLALALSYERTSPPSLQGFHHWIGTHDAEVKRDLEQGGGAVRIMTVHGAKGLEAPIVILPDTCRAPDHTTDPNILWLSPEPSAPVWVPVAGMHVPATLEARNAWRAAQEEEYLRLLYVAMTRARDRLYVTGWETRRGRSAGCWYDRLEAGLRPIASEVEVEGLGRVLRFESGAPPPRPEPKPAGAPPPLPVWAMLPPAPEPTPPRPLSPSRPSEDEPAVLAPLLDQGRRFRRGLLIHRLLQTLPDLPAERRREAGARFLALAAADLDPAGRAALLGEALELFALPEAAMLFGPGSRAEVPITGRVGDTLVAGQVDRLAVGADQVFIVDYKTNRPPPAAVQGVSAAYLRQMALYRGVLAQIFPQHRIRTALLWTDGPRFMEIPPDLLENRSP